MAEFKPEYIITEMKRNVVLAWGLPGTPLDEYVPGENRPMEHVLYIDGEVGPGTFYSESLWFFPKDRVSPNEISNEIWRHFGRFPVGDGPDGSHRGRFQAGLAAGGGGGFRADQSNRSPSRAGGAGRRW